ncbi:hypothetical protein OG455_00230 [Kitasatospora sp. NBC_01287]|uniref:hypothetical protein n=1 Tax=Kitasatospora sp. NBC_01287 TaxID=2903573 RepID=UPI0022528AD1|nr:hypothetical protein [Kitasatospora sp. NBC_01287]MCX4743953.1 hypothetical protein [Kitasatospora sp. NBC_01287]
MTAPRNSAAVVIGADASRHLMEPCHPLLAELGVTPSHLLKEVPTGETVLVAGRRAPR